MDKFFLDKFLDLLFPPKCGFCGEITMSNHFICNNCRNLSTQKYIDRCDFCGKISLEKKCFECNTKTLYYEKLFFCNEYTEEFKWLQDNAYKYGFILRYPKKYMDITGFNTEPWHYRYVGVEIATYIHEHSMSYEEYYASILDD